MSKSAVFVAWHQQIAGARELGMHLRDETRHHHGVDVGSGDQKPMDHVGRRKAQRHPADLPERQCTAART